MKIQELIERVERKDPIEFDSSLFDNEPGFMFGGTVWFEIPTDRLVGYSVYDVYDGNTVVGPRIFFFDGEFVFYTKRAGRKCKPEFYWESYEAHEKVKTYILSLVPKEEVSINLMDVDADLAPEQFNLVYAACVISQSIGYLDGEKVEVTRLPCDYCKKHKLDQKLGDYLVSVRFEDGTSQTVDVRVLEFRPNVKPKMLKDLSKTDKEKLADMVDDLYDCRVNLNTRPPAEHQHNRLRYWCALHNISFDSAAEYLRLSGYAECVKCGQWFVISEFSHLSDGETCHSCR